MDLLYKPEWEKTKENYKLWWDYEYFGRCAISVTAAKANIADEEPPILPERIEDRWLDFDYLTLANEYRMKHTFYGGEAFPIWHPGYPGCDGQNAYLGSDVKLAEETGWIEPLIEEGVLTDHDYKKLVINEKNKWRIFSHEVRKLSVQECKGKSIPTTGAFGGCGDTLSGLRSPNKLLYDVIDCPDYVQEFDQYLIKQWIEIFDSFYKITSEAAQGSAGWFELWSPGKFYALQNDFAYMISPKMFSEIFLPSIEIQANYLDHSVFHVDGIGNFAHVDALLEIPKIQAYQILPGAGKPSPLHYINLLKRVQDAGRNLHITINPNEVKDALELLSARGLFIDTKCETEEEANEILKYVEIHSIDKQ